MTKTQLTKKGLATVTAVIALGAGVLIGQSLPNTSVKTYENAQKIMLQENKRLSSFDGSDFVEYPQNYQEKQLLTVDKLVKAEKFTNNQKEVLYSLAYNNSSDYQNSWLENH